MAQTGSSLLTGNQPSIYQPKELTPETGSLVFTGNTPEVYQPRSFEAIPGSLVFAGNVPTISQVKDALRFYNGIRCNVKAAPTPGDVLVEIGGVVAGLRVVDATDDNAGCIRIISRGQKKAIAHL